jgi:hypothetical protein
MRVASFDNQQLFELLQASLPKHKGQSDELDSAIDDFLSRLSDDTNFGLAYWCDDDVRTALKRAGIDPDRVTDTEMESIRETYYCRHIDDVMVEHGWDAIEQAVQEVFESASPAES